MKKHGVLLELGIYFNKYRKRLYRKECDMMIVIENVMMLSFLEAVRF